jgi:putative membrane protein
MPRRFIVGVIAAGSVVVHTTLAFCAQGASMSELEQSYLQKAIQGHEAEVALGQLAVQKASSDQVKQYGARMIQDHQRVSEELHKLTSKEGTPLPSDLSMPHQQIQGMLSQLSGKDFDKAYISFIVLDHMKELGEWEQRASTLTDPRLERWTAGILPILNDHLARGRAIAATIGVNDKDLARVEEATSPSHPY